MYLVKIASAVQAAGSGEVVSDSGYASREADVAANCERMEAIRRFRAHRIRTKGVAVDSSKTRTAFYSGLTRQSYCCKHILEGEAKRIHMRQPKQILTTGLLIGIAAFSVPIHASTMWSWNYSGDGIMASGTFTTLDSPDAEGGYLITAISGVRNGQTITALQPTGTWIPGNEPYEVDNRVFAGPGPQLTKAGFGFALADGTYSNPFYADFLPTPGYLEFYSMPASDSSTELPVAFSASPVSTPEPATFGLLLLSVPLCYIAGFVFRAKSQQAR